jgi:hypothetical protein
MGILLPCLPANCLFPSPAPMTWAGGTLGCVESLKLSDEVISPLPGHIYDVWRGTILELEDN